MNKWGIRLIACLFFIRAIFDLFKLITNPGQVRGFLGLDLNLNSDGKPMIDVMAWVGVVILVYIGFQLFRFRSSGRSWALFVLWIATLSLGGALIWITSLVAKAFYNNETIYLSHTDWYGEIRGPIPFLLFLFGAFVFYAIPTYYLMRKDVKQLFEKNDTAEEPTTIPAGEKP